jgi:hypothetical protein
LKIARRDGPAVPAGSLLAALVLGARNGTEVTLRAAGGGAEAALIAPQSRGGRDRTGCTADAYLPGRPERVICD